jgi:6-phosphogluconolactonase
MAVVTPPVATAEKPGTNPLAKIAMMLDSYGMDRRIKVAPTLEQLAEQAAEIFVESAQRAIAAKGTFAVALSGGNTPAALYSLLAEGPFRSSLDWARIEIFFGDERCVPPESEQSNYHMARRTLLSKVPLPGDNIYRMRGEIDPNEAAKEYGKMLKEKFGDGGLDLVLLGMGDDGHTASLFPHTAALKELDHRCVANFVEKLSAWRITLTAPFINRSADVLVMVAGQEKAARVQEVIEGPRDPERLPIQLIEPEHGQMTWILDAGAAGMTQE